MESTATQLDLFQQDTLVNLTVLPGSDKARMTTVALWPEVKRLLEEIRPRWFVGENVAGHVTLGLDGVLSDLDDIGYTVQPVIIPAAAVGALHRRDRVFILAHANEKHGKRIIEQEIQGKQALQRFDAAGSVKEWADRSLLFEPKLCRSLNGFPNGVARSYALGNAVSPPQFYPIALAIKQIDDMMHTG
jgi:DNA (cytosine-5)-methyltransferase 1